jgi:uncharacterized protein YecE (DUF72 family)
VARVRVGTSGFSYKEWKRLFYPDDLSDRELLPFYASRFPTVEIDSTFYRMPSVKTLESWKETTPETFRFTLKAPQQITHRQRLRLPSEALSYFTGVTPTLETRLAFVQYQLPPFMKVDVDRLKAFLEVLPKSSQASFEFRHPSWFTPEVFDLLRAHSRILCIHDTDEGCSPMELTTNATCVRLRRTEYSTTEREEWRSRWRAWAAAGIDVFAYVKHKENPNAPLIALDFAEGFQV